STGSGSSKSASPFTSTASPFEKSGSDSRTIRRNMRMRLPIVSRPPSVITHRATPSEARVRSLCFVVCAIFGSVDLLRLLRDDGRRQRVEAVLHDDLLAFLGDDELEELLHDRRERLPGRPVRVDLQVARERVLPVEDVLVRLAEVRPAVLL